MKYLVFGATGNIGSRVDGIFLLTDGPNLQDQDRTISSAACQAGVRHREPTLFDLL
ncbi:MAG: hypothetical protein WBD02_09255 [Acidimicrobiia bacterium]